MTRSDVPAGGSGPGDDAGDRWDSMGCMWWWWIVIILVIIIIIWWFFAWGRGGMPTPVPPPPVRAPAGTEGTPAPITGTPAPSGGQATPSGGAGTSGSDRESPPPATAPSGALPSNLLSWSWRLA